jgi:imidazolonepropionase-like amidohydrolase
MIALALLSQLALAQDCLILLDTLAHLPDGPKPNTTLVVVGDTLAYVGPALPDLKVRPTPKDGLGVAEFEDMRCTVLSLAGTQTTPALIEAHSRLGLVEVSLESSSVDANSNEPDAIRAAFQVQDAYNPRSTLIPIARTGGLGSAIIVPGGGLVSGQSAWVDLVGGSQADSIVDGSVAVHAHIGGGSGSRAQSLLRLRELLNEARTYDKKRQAWESARYRDWRHEPLDLAAMQAVVSREVPLVVSANRASDIEALLRFVDEQAIDLVLVGGAEAWMVADQLADRSIPVIVNPLHQGPTNFDAIHSRPDNAALLHQAGVPVILASFSSHNARKLRQCAGNAVREGLPHAVALAGITSVPARAFGMPSRGVIEKGARADLAVWSGDPLELTTSLDHLILAGQDRSLVTRQTLLLERYRTLPDPNDPDATE